MFRSNNSWLTWEGVKSMMEMPTKRTRITLNSSSALELSYLQFAYRTCRGLEDTTGTLKYDFKTQKLL